MVDFKKCQLSLIFLRIIYFSSVFLWVGIVIASESQQAMDWILNFESRIPDKLFPKKQKPKYLPKY